MFVCSCKAVSDRTIRAAIEAGARTIEDLTADCSAGGRCGGCWPLLTKLLAEFEADRSDEPDTEAAGPAGIYRAELGSVGIGRAGTKRRRTIECRPARPLEPARHAVPAA